MNREPIFGAVRPMLLARKPINGGFTAAEVTTLNAAIDAAGGALLPPAAPAPVVFGPIEVISVRVLRAACPERSEAQLAPWVSPITAACVRFKMNTIRRVAAFISQMAHESSLIPGREENLNYSALRLAQVWPGRYADNPAAKVADRLPNALARRLGGNPEAVANNVYASRMGNGPEASGDGWRFRGAGPGMITGRSNWTRFAAAMSMTIDQVLAYGRTIEGGVMAFAWFWEENDINRLADTPGVADESKAVNGGAIGLADRTARFDATVAEMLKIEGEMA